MKSIVLGLTLLLTAFSARSALAVNEVSDSDQLRQRLGVTLYGNPAGLKNVKIAVLDNGFQGYVAGKGQLPASTEMPTLTTIGPASSNHGLGMAQIIWALTGKNADGPKFYLLTTNGFSNLKAAVQFVVQNKIDIVLYSQVWPFGGNFDGTGFINAQVTQAIQAGTIWINAAGNNGGMVFNSAITDQRSADGQFLMFNGRDHLRFENKLDENNVSITLSWTDYKDTETYNAVKDLDLLIYDENDKLVDSSELIQQGQAPAAGDTKHSSYAREMVTLSSLDRGKYKIKVRVSSKNFDKNDRLRILIKADKSAFEFTDKTTGGEVMPPADNPLALTVGENAPDTATGPTSDGRTKPEVIVQDGRVSFTNGTQARGSSTSAALVAGAVTLMKAQEPSLTMLKLRSFALQLGNSSYDADLESAELKPITEQIKSLVPKGGKLMIHSVSRRYVVLAPGDPFQLPEVRQAGVSKNLQDDVLAFSLTNSRYSAVPASQRYLLNTASVEFRQRPSSTGIWRTPGPLELRGLLH